MSKCTRKFSYNKRAELLAQGLAEEIAYLNDCRRADEPLITFSNSKTMECLFKWNPLLGCRIAKRYKPYTGEHYWLSNGFYDDHGEIYYLR